MRSEKALRQSLDEIGNFKTVSTSWLVIFTFVLNGNDIPAREELKNIIMSVVSTALKVHAHLFINTEHLSMQGEKQLLRSKIVGYVLKL